MDKQKEEQKQKKEQEQEQKQEQANKPIGIFDSGIGGVTVLKEILKELPYEKYIYYSDSKNIPYGDKTQEQIQNICSKIVQYFLQRNCKAIVIACNTASANAVEFLRKKYTKIPIIAIEPAYKMVYDNSYNEETLIMATKGTIESERFNLLLEKYNNHKTYIKECVGLADKIEEGNEKEIKKLLTEEIGEYKGKVKNVVLGCTHYPLIQDKIEEIIGDVKFFNGAKGVAVHLKEVLKNNNMQSDEKNQSIEFIDSSKNEQKKKRFFYFLECGNI